MMNIRTLASTVAALAAAVGMTSAAYAVPTISLSTGGTTVVVADGDILDVNNLPGAVTFVGPLNQWYLNVTTGVGFPILVNQPHLDLNSVNATSAPASNENTGLELMLTDTGFTQGIGGMAGFMGLIGGTTNGNIVWEMWLNTNNTLFGHGADLGSILIGTNSSGVGAYSDEFSNGAFLAGPGPYSMTLRVFITHPDGGQNTSFDFEGRIVPEPGTLLLLGMGLLGLALLRRQGS